MADVPEEGQKRRTFFKACMASHRRSNQSSDGCTADRICHFTRLQKSIKESG